MTIRFTATNTMLNGKPIVHTKGDRAQLAMMIKSRLGLK